MSADDYPFADGRNVRWTLEGFGRDESLCSLVTLSREQYLKVRGLFELGADEWMMTGSYPVPPEIQGPLRELVATAVFEDGVEYFLGACQNLPSGIWPPASLSGPFPGPVPPP